MFEGFSEQTGEFLIGLMLNNEKAWFEANRQIYQQYLLTPFRELAHDVAAQMQKKFPDENLDLHISRIYRDVRRAHGKGPYKDHLWFSLKGWEGLLQGPMFWFEIGPFDYSYGMGFYSATPAQMELFRKQVNEDPRPLSTLVRAYKKQDHFILTGESYARPKGSPPALLAEWYNKKRIGLEHRIPFGGELFSSTLPATVASHLAALMPYYQYFASLYRRSL